MTKPIFIKLTEADGTNFRLNIDCIRSYCKNEKKDTNTVIFLSNPDDAYFEVVETVEQIDWILGPYDPSEGINLGKAKYTVTEETWQKSDFDEMAKDLECEDGEFSSDGT